MVFWVVGSTISINASICAQIFLLKRIFKMLCYMSRIRLHSTVMGLQDSGLPCFSEGWPIWVYQCSWCPQDVALIASSLSDAHIMDVARCLNICLEHHGGHQQRIKIEYTSDNEENKKDGVGPILLVHGHPKTWIHHCCGYFKPGIIMASSRIWSQLILCTRPFHVYLHWKWGESEDKMGRLAKLSYQAGAPWPSTLRCTKYLQRKNNKIRHWESNW
jgi:hypothetical protein